MTKTNYFEVTDHTHFESALLTAKSQEFDRVFLYFTAAVASGKSWCQGCSTAHPVITKKLKSFRNSCIIQVSVEKPGTPDWNYYAVNELVKLDYVPSVFDLSQKLNMTLENLIPLDEIDGFFSVSEQKLMFSAE